MALPSKLKGFNVFMDGINFVGKVSEVTLPKLSRKMEEYRGGGMGGTVDIDLGLEKLEMSATYGGFMREIFTTFGAATHDAVLIRFAGGYQREDSEEVDAIEVIMRGRHKEIDMGSAKPGEDTEFKVSSSLSYYKLTLNGKTQAEIDTVNMIEIIDGVDRLAKMRSAIGL
ncbi:phage major tail tube protein [Janthinobacterium sp. B9-8]|uniref:phage major tail tube protein n=1 Tax=Janthinobacterium sp. B9-8 TaxID=1236179 RepID=UPI00061CF414|nr:phage major tail tube protein [Janthinobacterium sp. B9-8]AMC35388.1 phage tail protein [Janthinobacterium sp. B9-8]